MTRAALRIFFSAATVLSLVLCLFCGVRSQFGTFYFWTYASNGWADREAHHFLGITVVELYDFPEPILWYQVDPTFLALVAVASAILPCCWAAVHLRRMVSARRRARGHCPA